MKRIYKYKLDTTDSQIVEMHNGALILSCLVQNNIPYIYALVDTNTTSICLKVIEIFGTGNPIIDDEKTNRTFIGTYKLESGFVGHVFETT